MRLHEALATFGIFYDAKARVTCRLQRRAIVRTYLGVVGARAQTTLLAACGTIGLNPDQRAATVQFGQSLAIYGHIVAEETSHVRSEVKLMRVLALSLPTEQSSELFAEGTYTQLGKGLKEPRLEKLVAFGGRAERFGDSLATVAKLHSTTAQEKLFSTVAHNFVLVASSLAEGLANVSVAAPAVNLITFASTDVYRRRIIMRTLQETEPAADAAINKVKAEFASDDPDSLLYVYSHATDHLAQLLEAGSNHFSDSNLSAADRNLVASAFRSLSRNREHIRYVTAQQQQLAVEAEAAYDALLASFNGGEKNPQAINRFSEDVFQTELAFKSLR
jgi:hypothetical protein